ncbi:MAG: BamA/TamA family outer membrane protein [Saprospiraceae bacterium]|nr:BamA/TamA family outer membrane protein [Saprospiraceae bacterium]
MKKRDTLFLLLLLNQLVYGQKDSLPKNPNGFKIIALPIVFYTPDTKIGAGVGGLSTFNFKGDSVGARRSSVTVGLVYTQLKQILVYFPFQLFPKNQKYWLGGEVGYYRYTYNFFGIGNDFSPDYIEKFSSTYPRLRLSATKQIKPYLFVGFRLGYEDFTFTRVDSGGILDKKLVSGARGGRHACFGLQANYDSRDALFSPTKGWVVESYVYQAGAFMGGDFNFRRFFLEASHYISLGKKGVLAFNGSLILSNGDVPFHQMPVIGGTKRLRGYLEGKYSDRNLSVLQAEYRFPLYKRFGAVVFGGFGEVASTPLGWSLANVRYNYGTGLRFMLDPVQRINIRADYGIGYKSKGFYLTIAEAF